MTTRALCVFLASTIALVCAPISVAQEADKDDSFPWVRVGQTDSRVLRMGTGYRVYRAAGKPDVTMYGAVHIADPRYYDALEVRLEQHDVILFEGVGPPGSGDELGEDAPMAKKREWTERRVRLLAILAEQARARTGAYPEDLAALREALPERERKWVETASRDAWGHEISYEVMGGEVVAVSYGSDGKSGGRGAAADIELADQPPISSAEKGEEPGIQKRLADTFGLAFQLEEMDTSGEKYVNADLSIDEVDALLRERGGDGSMLFDMIGGSGLMTDIAGVVLKLIERMPGVAVRGKVMLMVMLGESEVLFEAGVPGMEGLLEVLIDRRNDRVVEDLAEVLNRDEAMEAGVGIIYGAGHMADLHARLVERFGYRPVDHGWLTAMRVDLDEAGISPSEMRFMKMSIDQQLAIMRARAGEN